MIIRFVWKLFLLVMLLGAVSLAYDALRYVVSGAPKPTELEVHKGTLQRVSDCVGRPSGIVVQVREGVGSEEYLQGCDDRKKLRVGGEIEIRKLTYPGPFFLPFDEIWSIQMGQEVIYTPDRAEKVRKSKFYINIFGAIVFAIFFLTDYRRKV